jgi:hypothetical protein
VAKGVVIRRERDADHPAIAEVVRAAFVSQPDEVASFVERIRASEQFVPELALVAEDSSAVIAHVMLSWVGVEGGSRTSRADRNYITTSREAVELFAASASPSAAARRLIWSLSANGASFSLLDPQSRD